jgi:baseplate J-like protein
MNRFTTPHLDDRSFSQLMAEAESALKSAAPAWSGLQANDPGTLLLELFAHLTETLLYRVNRVPEKAYVEFLRLLGARRLPPASAHAKLLFTRNRNTDKAVTIPRGTQITIQRAGGSGTPPVFTTDRDVELKAGETEKEVDAHHGELVEGELLGRSTGQPGQSFTVRQPPIIAPTGTGLDLVVGVEALESEATDRSNARRFGDKSFLTWEEEESFSLADPAERAFVVDRVSGRILFAPVAQGLGAIPARDREIRVWYRRGGGSEGNVGAGTLTVMKTPIAGLTVSNPAMATGGRDVESQEAALLRGPEEFRTLQRAVTADDYRILALRTSGGVARASAFTAQSLWMHATPGAVDVVIVPDVAASRIAKGALPLALLDEFCSKEVLAKVQSELDLRKTLGTACRVRWCRFKPVTVHARVVVHPEEEPEAVRARVLERLNRTLSPLASEGGHEGWRFGQELRVSTVYDATLAEPGVRYVSDVRLEVEDAPSAAVDCVTVDPFQPHTWYAAAGDGFYRSVNDGDGWELARRFANEKVHVIENHQDRPGLLAVANHIVADGADASLVHITRDCGDTWAPPRRFDFKVNDLAWMTREQEPVLLLATENGLFELALGADATPLPIVVEPAAQDLGMSAVAVAVDERGAVSIGVAARQMGGVYLSSRAGAQGSFRHIGLKDSDISCLEVQSDAGQLFLWAGLGAEKASEGSGGMRWRIRATEDAPSEWVAFQSNWRGGGCHALAFVGDVVHAATHHAGVLSISSAAREAAWSAVDVKCGLPMRDVERLLQPVETVAADARTSILLAGGIQGVHRRRKQDQNFENVSARESTEKVTLPGDWLLCSGSHQLDVASALDDEH